jgi:hypothetical protein
MTVKGDCPKPAWERTLVGERLAGAIMGFHVTGDSVALLGDADMRREFRSAMGYIAPAQGRSQRVTG